MLKVKQTPKENATPEKKQADLSFDEQLQKDIEAGKLIISVNAVASFYGRSIRTVCEWNACYADFPVMSGPHGVWQTCYERLEQWKAAHPEKFLSRQQMRDEATDERTRRRW